ncbi:MAG: hypothetical protein AB8F74_03295 [Saprospiraceae bacterium]
MLKQLVLTLLFLITLITVDAQVSAVERSVVQLFPNPDKVLWLRHYSGTIDDINDVTMVLAYDGKMCRGKMKYLKSEQEFGIVGFMKRQKIRLMELDVQKEISGYIEGKMEGRELFLDWSSADNSIGSKMLLRQSNKEVLRTKSDCGSEKWIKIFRGLVIDDEVEFLLQREADRQIRGLVYFNKENKSYAIKGEINRGGEVDLKIFDEYQKPKGSLNGTLTSEGLMEAVFRNPYGARIKSDFWLHETMEVGCLTYVDYLSSLGISFPLADDNNFNRWMSELVAKEQSSYKEFVNEARKIGTELNPETRASIRTYGWYDLDYLSVNIISGRLWITNSWEERGKGIPFNYDLDRSTQITLSSIFKNDFNLQDMIWAHLSKNVPTHQFYEDYDFRKWLSTASFDSFTIRQEGINFSTPFSPIYGQQEITISFEDLKEYMKPVGIVWEMAGF